MNPFHSKPHTKNFYVAKIFKTNTPWLKKLKWLGMDSPVTLLIDFVSIGNAFLDNFAAFFQFPREIRIPEYADLEGTQKDHRVQCLALHRIIPKTHTMCLRVSFKCFLNSVKLGAVITSLGMVYLPKQDFF
ncbi:hypothetical protein WISP_132373 [Willisornis vidua]|uniref:Uncharacterized protein n=1 Tax=Willisornis vidua TaxID=1566151 RepID=A0ABQ9CP88_9PASS|nr:hypothetical protein WISP_132373 [Willisornis vidua]